MVVLTKVRPAWLANITPSLSRPIPVLTVALAEYDRLLADHGKLPARRMSAGHCSTGEPGVWSVCEIGCLRLIFRYGASLQSQTSSCWLGIGGVALRNW